MNEWCLFAFERNQENPQTGWPVMDEILSGCFPKLTRMFGYLTNTLFETRGPSNAKTHSWNCSTLCPLLTTWGIFLRTTLKCPSHLFPAFSVHDTYSSCRTHMTITTLTILDEIFNHEIPHCGETAVPSQIFFRFAPQGLNISIKVFRVGAHTVAQIYIERPSGL
jgi:hypothetical protein